MTKKESNFWENNWKELIEQRGELATKNAWRYAGYGPYFNPETGKVSQEGITNLSCSTLRNALKFWKEKREEAMKDININSTLMLGLSVLIVALKNEGVRRRKRFLETSRLSSFIMLRKDMTQKGLINYQGIFHEKVPNVKYFNLKERKINKKEIAKLPYDYLENAYRFWHAKREELLEKEKPDENTLLILSLLIASLKKELDKRYKDLPEF